MVDHRQALNGILWKLQKTMPWHLVPDHFGSHWTLQRRLKDWRRDGSWQSIIDVLPDRARKIPPRTLSRLKLGD